MKSRIHPCLWFDRQAAEAARFQASVSANSRIGPITRHGLSWQIVPQQLMDLLEHADH